MNFSIATQWLNTALPILGVWQATQAQLITPTNFSTTVQENIQKVLRLKAFKPRLGNTFYLPPCEEFPLGVGLIGLGKENEYGMAQHQEAITKAFQAFSWAEELLFTDQLWLKVTKERIAETLACVITNLTTHTASWKKAPLENQYPSTVYSYTEDALSTAFGIGEKIGQSLAWGRFLANQPSNIGTPTFLAQEAFHMTLRCPNLQCRVYQKDELHSYGGLLGVAQGSQEPPVLIEITYQGTDPTKAPLALVGKGITFDAGGISLKPAAGMRYMIFDMCGAASVLATIKAIALLALPINVTVIVPACENLPSGTAMKPGDIIRTLSGRTVEVDNTDAEGRLILADAITHALQHQPHTIIDVATLTGAAVIALGSPYSALFSNRDDLAAALLTAGENTADLAWRMPLHPLYQKRMQSHRADLVNVSGKREGGSCTAAAFLQYFVRDCAWAHLDIAATAQTHGAKYGATGRPIQLLIEYCRNLVNVS